MAGVTTTQIAQRLNLSRNTVSKALNDSREVNDKTKQLVIETAMQMGYKKLKMSMLPEKEPTGYDIGLLVNEKEMMNNYWNLMLKGIQEELSFHRCRIIFGIVSLEDETSDNIPMALQGDRIAGTISIGTANVLFSQKIKNLGIPMVAIDTAWDIRDNRLIHDTILSCNNSAVYEITEHLIQGGYRDIAFVGNIDHSKSIHERWQGYRLAMLDHGIPIREESTRFLKVGVRNEPGDVARILDSIGHMPEAFVCANDNIAHKLMHYYAERGIRIPGEAAISGFDDYDISDEEQKITSVSYNIKELGNMAARQIVYRIENPGASRMIVRLESNVVYRDSTKAK